MSNDELTSHVTDELFWDPKVDNAAIAVSADDGVVTLGGTVGSLRQKREAKKDAERVWGVKSVNNDLQVRLLNDDRREDADLRGAVLQALMLDSQVPATVDADVDDGMVTLKGQANWHFQRDEAETVAINVAGVVSVDNAIELVPPSPRAEDLENSIEKAMERSAKLEAGRRRRSTRCPQTRWTSSGILSPTHRERRDAPHARSAAAVGLGCGRRLADGPRRGGQGNARRARAVALRRVRKAPNPWPLRLHGEVLTMKGDTISVLEGNTFVVSRPNGDVDAGPGEPHGLFHRDTRHLSRWLLTVDGKQLDALSTDDTKSFSASFFLVPGTGSEYTDATLSVIRRRVVGDGFFEELTVLNHGNERIRPEITIAAGGDFADLFQVKDATIDRPGKELARIDDGVLVLGYERGGYIRETWIRPHDEHAELHSDSIVFRPTIEPHGSWSTGVEVIAAVDGTPAGHERTRYRPGEELQPPAPSLTRPGLHPSLAELIRLAPALETDWEPLKLTYARSIVDLAALRFYPQEGSEAAVPAAGLPWFQTLFGRDSLITSYQSLHVDPDLAATTLDVLASLQGTRHDDFRDEEPGKIPHELRFGELTAFEERPHSPYYGSADGTMLFVILLDEYERFTGDSERVRRLEPNARAALAWIDEDGDRDGDGYVEYERRNTETGLENQCWKDSWNSILFADGELAKLPRATCELQGYVYDARRRAARLARELWDDDALGAKLEGQAEDLT